MLADVAISLTSDPTGILGVRNLAVALTNLSFEAPGIADEKNDLIGILKMIWPLALGKKFEKSEIVLKSQVIVLVKSSNKPPLVSSLEKSNMSPSSLTDRFMPERVRLESLL